MFDFADDSVCKACGVARLTFEPPSLYCTGCGQRIKRNQVSRIVQRKCRHGDEWIPAVLSCRSHSGRSLDSANSKLLAKPFSCHPQTGCYCLHICHLCLLPQNREL